MALIHTDICEFGWQAEDFRLLSTDGKTISLEQIRKPNGFVLMFICNHCPYVLAVVDRLASEGQALLADGIGVAAICSNDAAAYPEDSYDNMVRFGHKSGFAFPYLHDEDQSVARSYKAVCTPDIFGFNSMGDLQYRGRLDSARNGPATADTKRELYDAMQQVARTGHGPKEQTPSMGCSIKWKP